MKFIRLDVRDNNLNNLNAPDIKILKSDLRDGRSIGAAVLGERYFFVRKFRKAYYIPYDLIARCFRRVVDIPVKLGCCAGDMRMQYIIISGTNPDGAERELARIETPGEKAARILLQELKTRCPNAAFGVAKQEAVVL